MITDTFSRFRFPSVVRGRKPGNGKEERTAGHKGSCSQWRLCRAASTLASVRGVLNRVAVSERCCQWISIVVGRSMADPTRARPERRLKSEVPAALDQTWLSPWLWGASTQAVHHVGELKFPRLPRRLPPPSTVAPATRNTAPGGNGVFPTLFLRLTQERLQPGLMRRLRGPAALVSTALRR